MKQTAKSTTAIFARLSSALDAHEARLRPFAWLLVRVAAGLLMIPHGVPKLFGTFAPVLAAKVLAPLGMPAPLLVAYILGVIEVVGGALVAAGLLTRLIALVLLGEATVITLFVSLPKGWIYSVPGGGAEYPALLMVVFAALVLRGAGPYSVEDFLRSRRAL